MILQGVISLPYSILVKMNVLQSVLKFIGDITPYLERIADAFKTATLKSDTLLAQCSL